MSLDSKSVKKLYPVFVQITSMRLGRSFFFIIMLSALSRGVKGSDKPGKYVKIYFSWQIKVFHMFRT